MHQEDGIAICSKSLVGVNGGEIQSKNRGLTSGQVVAVHKVIGLLDLVKGEALVTYVTKAYNLISLKLILINLHLCGVLHQRAVRRDRRWR